MNKLYLILFLFCFSILTFYVILGDLVKPIIVKPNDHFVFYGKIPRKLNYDNGFIKIYRPVFDSIRITPKEYPSNCVNRPRLDSVKVFYKKLPNLINYQNFEAEYFNLVCDSLVITYDKNCQKH